ncbi:MAG: hypothetical protein EXR69_03330 [Myxococcales bacterium]|nr:hypothetical protein [Myxococcales bacterium]
MILFALLGCVTAQNFSDKSVAVICARLEECDKGSFEAFYSDANDCRNSTLEDSRELLDCYAENCDFDAGAASECLAITRAASCEDYSSGAYVQDCEEIYTDCDESSLTECLLSSVF